MISASDLSINPDALKRTGYFNRLGRLGEVRRVRSITVTCVAIFVATTAIAAGPDATSPPLKCEVGPVEKTFGNSRWLVYSCDDNRSIVLVSAPGSLAMPFVFAFTAKGNRYQLSGEGTGRKEATEAAFNELKVLSEQEIASLIAQTKAQKRN